DVANAAAQSGLKVAIVEKGMMGGTCLNRGCIPSKLLIHSANVADTIRHARTFGINVDNFSIDFEKIVKRVNNITDTESEAIKNSYQKLGNPKFFPKECKFLADKKISFVNGETTTTITADKILIASGTKPKIPEIKGLQGSGFITSDEALRLKQQPSILTFIGGGYITCELAHFYGSLGTKINIVQLGDKLIPNEDKDISQKFTEVFSRRYNVYLGYSIESVTKKKEKEKNSTNKNFGSEIFHITAKNDTSGKSLELNSDQLLLAIGRIPNSHSLDIEKTGVKLDQKGFIIVDEYLETHIKGIFALGDVVGRYQFKHNANHEAQYAYHNILNSDRKIPVEYYAMPHAIFSSPQVAGVGFTEQQLEEEDKKEGKDYLKCIYPYIQTAMGKALEDRDGFVKFLVNREDRKVLGCHIIGTDASTLIHEVLVTMKAGDGTIDSIRKTIHIHPALSEVIAGAAGAID
ncbi:MAG TPA: dihydrolipoyl dehydrogenase, partial [Nitrososphaeraceae archaeon]|nr:dihydrolipoyl dehydrogenase [Nitrososphaeraceae archaeon]